MLKRWFHSSRGIFVSCVVITNALSGVLTAFLWLKLADYIVPGNQPASPLLPMVLSILLAVPISSVISKRSAKPLQDMVEATKAISKGDYSVRVQETGDGDIRELLHSFNQMTAELGSTEMMRNDFINTFSHEFKTPIVSIRGFAKRLKNGKLSPEKQQKYLTYIAEESERLSDLASSVLLIARYENQNFVTEQMDYELDEQVRRCVLRLESLWSGKHLNFELDLPKLPYRNNEEMVEHLWMNLISNAIKFSHSGGTIYIEAVQRSGAIEVSVRDEGVGMTEDAVKHIFDKFYQADTAHSSAGNGLGLPLVQRIVQLSGGNIHVSSQMGLGTTFTVTLPIAQKAAISS